MTLAELQRRFYQLAARAPGSESFDPAQLITGTPSLDAGARVGIYADMFIWRQIDALSSTPSRLSSAMVRMR